MIFVEVAANTSTQIVNLFLCKLFASMPAEQTFFTILLPQNNMGINFDTVLDVSLAVQGESKGLLAHDLILVSLASRYCVAHVRIVAHKHRKAREFYALATTVVEMPLCWLHGEFWCVEDVVNNVFGMLQAENRASFKLVDITQ